MGGEGSTRSREALAMSRATWTLVSLCWCLVTCARLCSGTRDVTDDVFSSSDDERLMISQFMDAQNKARAQVGVPPLTWSYKVAQYAQWWAEQRRQYGHCSMAHSPESSCPYGENIFWGEGHDERGQVWSPYDATNSWVGEKYHYHYSSNSCDPSHQCDHYTQIVWKSSLRIGCAKATCGNDVFMICNYDPPGNYIDERPY